MYKITTIENTNYLDRYREALNELGDVKMFAEVHTIDGVVFAVGGNTVWEVAEGIAELAKTHTIRIDEVYYDGIERYLKTSLKWVGVGMGVFARVVVGVNR